MRPPECDLPHGEAKCLPRGHCAQATVCARWLAPMQRGQIPADFTLGEGFQQGKCPKHLPAALHCKRMAGGSEGAR